MLPIALCVMLAWVAMAGFGANALDRSPNRYNTIVLLGGDQGFHLGEKEHWQKYSAWRQTGGVPLIIRVPKGAPGLSDRAPLSSATLPNPAFNWLPADGRLCPTSKVSTNAVTVAFTNYSGQNVKLYRIDAAGNRESFGTLAPIQTKRVQTYTGEVWLVTDGQDKDLGHFLAGMGSARAEIEPVQP
jgi:hypothetical protein